jgi:hypothetical protein
MRTLVARGVIAVALVGALPSAADAQIYEILGTRAKGMGGAFVAVADDADAAWWNPAGLAGGPYFNAIVAYDQTEDPHPDTPGQPAWRSAAPSVVFAFPSLALSYYRFRLSELSRLEPAASGAPDREDPGSADLRLGSFVVDQWGMSVGQSLTDHLVVASTVKLVHGSYATAPVAAGDASLDRAEGLDGPSHTQLDLDLGVMAVLGRTRLGLAIKNLREPVFGAGADTVELPMQARLGASVTAGARGRGDALTLAFDADLTRTPTALGDQRRVAAGAEAWMARRRLGLRGGVNANTVGAARFSASGGVSIAVHTGFYVDGQASWPSGEGRGGWGLATRVTF